MVFVREFASPPFNINEILRYAGVRSQNEDVMPLVRECLSEVEGKLSFKACYAEYPVTQIEERTDLCFTDTESKGLTKNLRGCSSAVIFAATVGIGIDRLIARYKAISPAKSLIFQAIGAERIEALCDMICAQIREEKRKAGYGTRPRFSPGYGDLPLDMQKSIFSVLDCPKMIGVSLNESLLMSPSKSVTAVIGIYEMEKSEQKL